MEEREDINPDLFAPGGGLGELSPSDLNAMIGIILSAIQESVRNANMNESAAIVLQKTISILKAILLKHLHINKLLSLYNLAKGVLTNNEELARDTLKKLLLGGKGSMGHLLDAIKEIDNGRAVMAIMRNPEYKRILGKMD